jgi:ribosome-associated toxin RatA of RatAB toxin-antitoxin module
MSTRGEKTVVVHVPLRDFWQTITDYTSYPQILDDVKTATIVERTEREAVVAFTIKVLLKGFDYTLRMREEPPDATNTSAALTWSMVSSSTLAQNDGGWRLEKADDHSTRVTYWNELASKGLLPKSFINGLVRIALPTMLKRWSSFAEARAKR